MKKLNTDNIEIKNNEDPLINNKNKINFIEKPNNGGIPAKDIIVIKNIKLNGNVVPIFLKSLRFFKKRTSYTFNKKKNENTKNMYINNIDTVTI